MTPLPALALVLGTAAAVVAAELCAVRWLVAREPGRVVEWLARRKWERRGDG